MFTSFAPVFLPVLGTLIRRCDLKTQTIASYLLRIKRLFSECITPSFMNFKYSYNNLQNI